MSKLGTVITAMVTPFSEDGRSIDEVGASKLLEHLIENGSDGVVIAGTTGEAPTLSDDEQVSLVELAVNQAAGRLTIIAGAGSNDTRHAVHLTERVAAAGADAILSVTPYYNRPEQRGIHAHFEAVASASDLPVILYNVPSRTGTDMSDELCREIGNRNETVVGIKQARSGVPNKIDGLDLYAGNDDSFAAALDNGAVGGILVASHIIGKQMRSMALEPENRSQLDAQMRSLYDALGVTTNPIP
ncbi:MAG: 4-hydroxy-tetrahydrodipicolinate synthase, partial [Solirubrobacterales bacterium]|nr:4-hydroxy-tetrahydrodipicolinate synthase [Solirubrobacterales bacterium]